MSRKGQLHEKQRAVLDDVFNGEYDEERLRVKHHLRKGTLARWLSDDLFVEGFERSLRSSWLRSSALLASCSQMAAAKLIELTGCEQAETARRACLDIIGFGRGKDVLKRGVKSVGKVRREESRLEFKHEIPAEKASRLLAVLAEE
jgi:hypothetical protein